MHTVFLRVVDGFSRVALGLEEDSKQGHGNKGCVAFYHDFQRIPFLLRTPVLADEYCQPGDSLDDAGAEAKDTPPQTSQANDGLEISERADLTYRQDILRRIFLLDLKDEIIRDTSGSQKTIRGVALVRGRLHKNRYQPAETIIKSLTPILHTPLVFVAGDLATPPDSEWPSLKRMTKNMLATMIANTIANVRLLSLDILAHTIKIIAESHS